MSPRKAAALRGGAVGLAEHLVATAARLIAERGTAGLTVRAIAREAGVADGVLYNHFADKEQLLAAGLHAHVRAVEDGLDPLPGPGTRTVEENLRAHLVHGLALHRAVLPAFTGLLAQPQVIAQFTALAGETPQWRDRLAAYLHAERALGRLAAHADPAVAAAILVGVCHDVVLSTLLTPDAAPTAPPSVDAVIATVLSGIGLSGDGPFRRRTVGPAVPDGRGPLAWQGGAGVMVGPRGGEAGHNVLVGDIVVVRHGQTEWSANGRHTSRTDLDLTADGEAAARRLSRVLQDRPFVAVLSSPRRRARRTAALAGLVVTAVDADVAEWDYGDLEGLTTPQIRESHPDWALWTDGCPGGESPQDVTVRIDRFLTRVRPMLTVGDVAVISHGHASRSLGARWLGEPVAFGARLSLDTATVSVLGHEHGEPSLRMWNASL